MSPSPLFLVACVLSAPLFYIPVVISEGMEGGEETITKKSQFAILFHKPNHPRPFQLAQPNLPEPQDLVSYLPVPWALKV